MEDMDKKEELEQTVTEEIEETAETVEEIVSETEEPAEEAAPEGEITEETTEEVPAKQEKGGSNIIGIILGLVLFVAFLAVVWMAPVGNVVKDTGVLYAKENNLYHYDMKYEPYLLQ